MQEEADARLELGGRALEGGVGLVVAARLRRRVDDAPVDRLWAAGELGADLAHPVAETDDVVEALGG